MYSNTPQKNTKQLLDKLKKIKLLRDFYLSGGTGLALQIGHRESKDLDFFSQKDFQPELLQKELEKIGKLENVQLEKGTLNCFIDKVQIQFLHYPYKLLEKKVNWQNIFVSSVLDIACTKLLTISSRGSKKDFIDLYFLLEKYPLPLLFEKLKDKYPKTDYNLPHILKSLVYFEDADKQPPPRMHKKVTWEEVKKRLKREVKNFKI